MHRFRRYALLENPMEAFENWYSPKAGSGTQELVRLDGGRLD